MFFFTDFILFKNKNTIKYDYLLIKSKNIYIFLNQTLLYIILCVIGKEKVEKKKKIR